MNKQARKASGTRVQHALVDLREGALMFSFGASNAARSDLQRL